MWKNALIGRYMQGNNILQIEPLEGTYDFNVFINGLYENTLESIGELQDYLKSIGVEEVILPKKVEEIETWFAFSGNENYKQVFSKKKKSGKIQTVLVTKFDNYYDYAVYMRETDYNKDEYLLHATLEYIDDHNKNPENDLEVDANEATYHTGSGMNEWHFNLRSMEDVEELLKNEYGILVNEFNKGES